MLDREPFLKAIFADPDNDHPRLVFADWLDDRGESDWAEVIRIQCEAARHPDDPRLAAREAELLHPPPWEYGLRIGTPECPSGWRRGFPNRAGFDVNAHELLDPDAFRANSCRDAPERYGATFLTIKDGRIATPAVVGTLLTSPVTEHVTRLDLSGREEQLGTAHDDALGIGLIDFVYRPAITPRMVEHLCGLREARRLVALDLSRNDLDNDAVRALVRSTNLIRLTELAVHDGNPRVKGRVWGELRERFGEGVVR